MKKFKSTKRELIDIEMEEKVCDHCGMVTDFCDMPSFDEESWQPIERHHHAELIEIKHTIIKHQSETIGESFGQSIKIELCPKCFRKIFKDILKKRKKDYDQYDF